MPVKKPEAVRKFAVYTGLGKVKLAADTQIVVDQPLESEDEFRSLYERGKATNAVLEPKFDPTTLMLICFRNSILQQCIQAMEVNIDGTGHTIEPIDQGTEIGGDKARTDVKDQFVDKFKDKAQSVKDRLLNDRGIPDNGDNSKVMPFEKAKKAIPPFIRPKPESDFEKLPNENRNPALRGKVKAIVNPEDPEKRKAEDFFKEPYPGMSMITIRRKLRVDLEQCGQGYLEAVENVQGEIVMLRHIPAQTMRKLRLDEPVPVERTLMRDGKETSVQFPYRERRYVQIVGNRQYYYKEFGCTRDVNRDTGEWVEKEKKPTEEPKQEPDVNPVPVGNQASTNDTPGFGMGSGLGSGRKADKATFPVPSKGVTPNVAMIPGADPQPFQQTSKLTPDKRGSQIIEFGIDRDPTSSYYVPRWINNLPSILGARKAEEFNLEFFDAGGIPPILILLEGGSLTPEVRNQIQLQLSGKNSKHRAAIVEVQSASGTLEKPGQVGVKVERFGDSRQGDSLFTNYNEQCDEDVRTAFRLPPLFLGQAQDYNFATAVVAYMVAEEQVFGPERKEFDEIINKTLMKALNIKKYKFVSKPITLKNVDIMLQALEAAKGYITNEEYIDKLNEISGMNMEFDAETAQRTTESNDPLTQAKVNAEAQAQAKGYPPGAGPGTNTMPGGPPVGNRPPTGLGTPTKVIPMRKSLKGSAELVTLAQKWCMATGLSGFSPNMQAVTELSDDVEALADEDRKVFDRLVAMKTFTRDHDPDGVAELAGAYTDMRRT